MPAIPPCAGGVIRRVRLRVVVAVVAVVLLGGCYYFRPGESVSLTRDDVVGSWCAEAGDFLVIEEDDTFRLTHMSHVFYSMIERVDRRDDEPRRAESEYPTSASGSWRLLLLGERRRLSLLFDEIDDEPKSFGTGMFGHREDGQVYLIYYASDPDLGYTDRFARCEEPHPAV